MIANSKSKGQPAGNTLQNSYALTSHLKSVSHRRINFNIENVTLYGKILTCHELISIVSVFKHSAIYITQFYSISSQNSRGHNLFFG